MTAANGFDGVVLCGGASRRMGTDKSLLPVDGIPMARRVADALVSAGASTVAAVGGDAGALAAAGLVTHDDTWPGEGPLGGVITGLQTVGTQPTVVVLGCDLVSPDADLVARLATERDRSGADLVVPVVADRPQWVHAAWRREAVAALLDAFADGGRSLVGATDSLRVDRFEVADPAAVADADAVSDLPRVAYARDVDIPEIDIQTLSSKLADGAPVFDVRQPDEYEEAHVPGVRLVPLDEVPERVDEFPTDETVYVICRTGGRSGKAAEFLRANGVDAVNVAGGTLGWINAEKPVDTGA